ncbi:hypothetical protein [Chromobacterium violaceum]|uniref:Uncharacterized protein n=1 Tax=Chromobacterium violaceum TaxID=536 RepID=A0A202B5I5_CHRVL|nr:hypothetical protein [Chromobacterium violaceum]OVE46679.1 hypothetical protein CBW21_17435 [Chromobacterium violaceum]
MKPLAFLLPLVLATSAHAVEITPSLVAATTRWQSDERIADTGAGVALNIRPQAGPEWGAVYIQHRIGSEAEHVLAVGPRWKTSGHWHVGASPQLVALQLQGSTIVRPALTLTGGYNGYHLDLMLLPDTRARPSGAWLWIRTDL